MKKEAKELAQKLLYVGEIDTATLFKSAQLLQKLADENDALRKQLKTVCNALMERKLT